MKLGELFTTAAKIGQLERDLAEVRVTNWHLNLEGNPGVDHERCPSGRIAITRESFLPSELADLFPYVCLACFRLHRDTSRMIP